MSTSKTALAVGTLVVAALGLTALGCNTAHLKELKSAASEDMKCPKSRVHILTDRGKTRDVEACGQIATYKWEGDDWRMIARGTGAQPAQPAQRTSQPPAVAPAQPAPAGGMPTGTPSQPPPSQPPPGRQL